MKTEPGCHCNEICDIIGYNSSRIGNIAEIIVHGRGFLGVGLLIIFTHFRPPWP